MPVKTTTPRSAAAADRPTCLSCCWVHQHRVVRGVMTTTPLSRWPIRRQFHSRTCLRESIILRTLYRDKLIVPQIWLPSQLKLRMRRLLSPFRQHRWNYVRVLQEVLPLTCHSLMTLSMVVVDCPSAGTSISLLLSPSKTQPPFLALVEPSMLS